MGMDCIGFRDSSVCGLVAFRLNKTYSSAAFIEVAISVLFSKALSEIIEVFFVLTFPTMQSASENDELMILCMSIKCIDPFFEEQQRILSSALMTRVVILSEGRNFPKDRVRSFRESEMSQTWTSFFKSTNHQNHQNTHRDKVSTIGREADVRDGTSMSGE